LGVLIPFHYLPLFTGSYLLAGFFWILNWFFNLSDEPFRFARNLFDALLAADETEQQTVDLIGAGSIPFDVAQGRQAYICLRTLLLIAPQFVQISHSSTSASQQKPE